MFFKLEKKVFLIFLGVFLLAPFSAFAGPGISWGNLPTNNNGAVSGSVVVSGIDTGIPPLEVFLFTDSDGGFNPYGSFALLGPASNASYNFTMPSNTFDFILPVLVTEGSFNGSPSFDPTTAYIVGQTATVPVSGLGEESGDDGSGEESGDDGSGEESGDDGSGEESGEQPPFSITAVINNPLGVEFNNIDILEFLRRLFENFVKIALPFLVLFVVWAGLQFVLARGNKDKLEEAKKNLLWVIIGTAIVFGAWGLANILSGTVDQFEALNFITKLLV